MIKIGQIYQFTKISKFEKCQKNLKACKYNKKPQEIVKFSDILPKISKFTKKNYRK